MTSRVFAAFALLHATLAAADASESPSAAPSGSPSDSPSASPSAAPSASPTALPTMLPSPTPEAQLKVEATVLGLNFTKVMQNAAVQERILADTKELVANQLSNVTAEMVDVSLKEDSAIIEALVRVPENTTVDALKKELDAGADDLKNKMLQAVKAVDGVAAALSDGTDIDDLSLTVSIDVFDPSGPTNKPDISDGTSHVSYGAAFALVFAACFLN